MKLIIRQLVKEDYKPYKELFDEAYYEYLEGAHYFSSLADERFFGLFQPPIEQRILVL